MKARAMAGDTILLLFGSAPPGRGSTEEGSTSCLFVCSGARSEDNDDEDEPGVQLWFHIFSFRAELPPPYQTSFIVFMISC